VFALALFDGAAFITGTIIIVLAMGVGRWIHRRSQTKKLRTKSQDA
jgi:uncharacterized integral membrane protein